jgi:hypothetical protein
MKFVSKFQLGLPLARRGCVAPGHGILLGPNTELERGAIGGQPSLSLEETDSFSEQGKHRCIILV